MGYRSMCAVVAGVCVVVSLTATATPDPPRQADASGGRPRRVPAEVSDRLTHSPLTACDRRDVAARRAGTDLRIATWNIQAALAAPVDAIAAELRAMHADVVALQEVDVMTRRGGFVDAPAELARALGFHFAFAASIKWDEGDYGLAVLSRWPLTDVRRHRLSIIGRAEPRIVLDATVCVHGRPLRLFNHHADRRVASRGAGFKEFTNIVRPHVGLGILVLGDFNEYPDGPGVLGLMSAGLVDVGAHGNAHTTDNGRIDYVLTDRLLARRASTAGVWPTDKSDHDAVLVRLDW